METVKICSLNVRGLKTNIKRKALMRHLRKQSYDILALQETYLNEEEIKKFEKEMNLLYHHSCGIGRSKGLITVFSKNLDYKNIDLIFKSNRVLISKLFINSKTFYIINIYAPCTDNDKITFFEELRKIIEDNIHSDDWGKIICLGDFNTVRDNKLDIISGTLHAQRTIDAFNEFSELSYLHDIWREQNPNLKASKPNMTSARRLDYILTGSSFTNSNHNLETFSVGRAIDLLLQVNLG